MIKLIIRKIGGINVAINDRIKELRKNQKLTLEKFGETLGVTKVAISNIENGKRNLTEQMFKSICREYNVNEEWLRTGKGDMYKLVEDEVSAAASDITDSDDDFIKDFIVIYRSLSPSSKYALHELIMGIHTRMKAREEKEGEQD